MFNKQQRSESGFIYNFFDRFIIWERTGFCIWVHNNLFNLQFYSIWKSSMSDLVWHAQSNLMIKCFVFITLSMLELHNTVICNSYMSPDTIKLIGTITYFIYSYIWHLLKLLRNIWMLLLQFSTLQWHNLNPKSFGREWYYSQKGITFL